MDTPATTSSNDSPHLQISSENSEKVLLNLYIKQSKTKGGNFESPSLYAPAFFNPSNKLERECSIQYFLFRDSLCKNHKKGLEEQNTKKNGLPRESRPIGPIQIFNTILKTWQLDESHAIVLLGLEPFDQGYAADLLAGRKVVKGRDVKDRLAYLIQIRMTLSGWFRNEAVENEWLREPQKLLDGEVPMELLLEGSMENLLLVKEYVQAATGW